jgi:tripartite-type tricarboxylate transporter receptor subunit TctC
VVVGTAPGAENPDADAVTGVPTLDEVTGQDGLGAALEQHRIIVGPPGISECIVDKLSTGLTDVFSDSGFTSQAEEAGLVPVHLDADEAQGVLQNTIDVLTEYKDLLTEQLAG